MRKLFHFGIVASALVAAFSSIGTAQAQQTYPTAASGVRVPGTVPLQCDANGANCRPASGSNPVAVQGVTYSSNSDSGSGFPATGAINLLPTWSFSSVYNGSNWFGQRGDRNGTIVQPALGNDMWSYAAAAGGIVNTTTPVTIRAADGSGRRAYLCSINVSHDTLSAGTELAVRNGAAGPVLFRTKLQTAANEGESEITFTPCLRGSANTLLEVVTLTAVTGGVYVNASGFFGF